MARPRRVRQKPQELDDDELLDGEGQAPASSVTEEVERQAEARLAEREPQAQIRRVDPLTGKVTFLDTISASIVNEEWLAENYGGGKYQVYRRGLVNGKWQYAGFETFEIDESIPFKGSLKAQKIHKAERDERDDRIHERFDPRMMRGGDDEGGMGDIVKGGILTLMRESSSATQMNNQMLIATMEQSRNANQMMMQQMLEMFRVEREARKPSIDIVQLIGAISPLVPSLIQLFQRKEQTSVAEIATLIEKFQPKGGAEKFDELLNLAIKLRDATGGDGDGNNNGNGLMGAIGKALEVLPALVQARSGVPASATATMTPQPMAVPPILPPTPENGVGEANDVWTAIGSRLPLLIGAAAINRNPGRTAAVAVEFASPQERAVLTELVAVDDFVPQLFQRFPQLVNYRVWTLSFIEALRFELLGEDDDEEEEENVTGAQDQPVVPSTPVIPIAGDKKGKRGASIKEES